MTPTKDASPPSRPMPALGPIVVTLLATLAVSILFRLAPSLDIATSRFFYVAGAGFPAAGESWPRALRTLGLWTMDGGMAICGILLLLRLIVPRNLQPVLLGLLAPSRLMFLVASAAIGPGLITNVILKDHWGRARPYASSLFGGDAAFSLPWTISDACHSNCSFVSGEGSGVFWLMALAFLVPAAWRTRTVALLVIWVFVVSLNRIAFGGHFLSDVVIGWGLVMLVILVCREIFLIRYGTAIDARIARWQDRR